MVDAGEDVAHVAAAEVAAVGVDELLAVAGAAAKVRLEDGVAVGGEDLHGEVEAQRRAAVRPAVRIDDQLVRRLGDASGGSGQDAFDLQPSSFFQVTTVLSPSSRSLRKALPAASAAAASRRGGRCYGSLVDPLPDVFCRSTMITSHGSLPCRHRVVDEVVRVVPAVVRQRERRRRVRRLVVVAA